MAKIINHPAFPVTPYAGDVNNSPLRGNSGMSMRDFFANTAFGVFCKDKSATPEEVAADAFAYADAMLVEREIKHTYDK